MDKGTEEEAFKPRVVYDIERSSSPIMIHI